MRQQANFREFQVPDALQAECRQHFLRTKPAGLNRFGIPQALYLRKTIPPRLAFPA